MQSVEKADNWHYRAGKANKKGTFLQHLPPSRHSEMTLSCVINIAARSK